MRIAALWLLCAIPLAAQSLCVIQGTIADSLSGKLVVGAKVYAHPTASGFSSAYLRQTNAEGRFCFERVAPGTYHLIAQRVGYLDQSYGATVGGEQGMDLAVETETALAPLTIELTPRPILSGVVLHADGQPAPGFEVTVAKRVHTKEGPGPDTIEAASTDDRGAFRFTNLAPGTYYLIALPDSSGPRYSMEFLNNRGEPINEAETATYYPAAATFADARPIVLKAGQEILGIAIALRKTPLRRISGKVMRAPKDAMIDFEPESDGLPNAAIALKSDGSFEHSGILPGKYVLQVPAVDAGDPRIRQEVDLTSADAENLIIEPRETLTLPLVMKAEGSSATLGLADIGVILNPIPRGESIGAQNLEKDGIGFAHVLPSIYSVQLNQLLDRPRFYLKQASINGEPQSPRRLDLRAPPNGSLELTFSVSFAAIEGLSDKPAIGVTVLLVRPGEENDNDEYEHRASTNQDGRFQMNEIEPGTYRLYAIEGFDEGPWGGDGLADSLPSIEVELREKETREVTVPLVRAAEWKAAVERFAK